MITGRAVLCLVATVVIGSSVISQADAQCAGCGADYNRMDRQRVENQGRPAAQGYIPGRESNESQGRQLRRLENEGN